MTAKRGSKAKKAAAAAVAAAPFLVPNSNQGDSSSLASRSAGAHSASDDPLSASRTDLPVEPWQVDPFGVGLLRWRADGWTDLVAAPIGWNASTAKDTDFDWRSVDWLVSRDQSPRPGAVSFAPGSHPLPGVYQVVVDDEIFGLTWDGDSWIKDPQLGIDVQSLPMPRIPVPPISLRDAQDMLGGRSPFDTESIQVDVGIAISAADEILLDHYKATLLEAERGGQGFDLASSEIDTRSGEPGYLVVTTAEPLPVLESEPSEPGVGNAGEDSDTDALLSAAMTVIKLAGLGYLQNEADRTIRRLRRRFQKHPNGETVVYTAKMPAMAAMTAANATDWARWAITEGFESAAPTKSKDLGTALSAKFDAGRGVWSIRFEGASGLCDVVLRDDDPEHRIAEIAFVSDHDLTQEGSATQESGGGRTGSAADVVDRLEKIGIHAHPAKVTEVAVLLFKQRPEALTISDRQFDVLARAFLLYVNYSYEFEEVAKFIHRESNYEDIVFRLKAGLVLIDEIAEKAGIVPSLPTKPS